MVAEIQNFEHAARLSMASFVEDDLAPTSLPFWSRYYTQIGAFVVAVVGTGLIGFAFI